MNALDFRSSQSSYGDPRHFSAASYGAPQPPPTKVLLDGYRNELGPGNAEKSMYNALNSTSHPRRSIPPSTNDPVAMYLLAETAMGDSMNYEVLSVEEVEGLKKELRVLSSRTNATKRKLTLELKLRDAAMSLSRLHNNEGYHDGAELNDANPAKTNEELALSNRKCEELSMDVWHSERQVQEIQKRLLEHTAGVLQLTHKGLKKNLKNGIPHTPESLSSNNTVDEFDDRSLYKSSDHHDEVENYGTRAPQPEGLSHEVTQETERRLEFLGSRLRDMLLQSDPNSEFSHLPQPSCSGDLDAHIRYIENGLEILGSQPKVEAPSQGLDRVSEQQFVEMSQQLLSIMENPDLPRAQTLPPAPNPADADLAEHLTYLSVGISGLESRVNKLLEQKSILTTQIQQQRELNSKSDAERDAKISELIEELAHSKKELEVAERQDQQSKEDLDLTMKELEDVRRELAEVREVQMQNNKGLDDSETQAREHAEAEIMRLQNIIQEIQNEKNEHHEAQARVRVEGEVARLQGVVGQLQDSTESRESAEQQVAQLEETIHQIRNDADIRVKEATDMHEQANAEIHRLEEAMSELREELESRLKNANESRTQAEENSARLQKELTDLEGDVVRAQTELTMAKAELDGAYGTRAQRAAEAAADPALFQELDDLKARNFEMAEELAGLKAGKPGPGDVQNRVQTLEKELRETVDDYEAMTKASIEFEKERERFEGMIDNLRDRCEQLETQINEERISWMGSNNSASSMGRDGPYETTSTMVLKNEFKKMMRDTRAENMKILKAEHEERRKLEAIIRELKKEQANMSGNPTLSQTGTAL
ncbi:involucrin repeat protein [Aspergillus undulatus]|uniref:involucrin repeat protein n=1 Tax=Aspergillus undulatus TaxID=1810928 RepID=UPI003CCCC212